MKKLFDFTMSLDEKTPVFPGDPRQEITEIATLKENGWNEKRLSFNSHFSTHIDAPYHMLKNGKKLDEFPLETFKGDAVVLDLLKPDLELVKPGDIVFFCTNQTKKAHSRDFFSNNPVITLELAGKLIEKKAKVVGIDSFTVDNEPFPVHKMLLKNGVLIVENLVNLEQVEGIRFECIIAPLNIKDADGAPCRVFGWLK